ncbi:MAG: hypothetical protein K6T65_01620, partial [Peptococcaceae bacterium]|nr:hypothetical protein [Peptococcaceae bacterium]
YNFTVSEGGTYTVSAKAWPVDLEDAHPDDNTDSTSITVIKEQPPETGSKEPGLHSELGGGGPPPDDWYKRNPVVYPIR